MSVLYVYHCACGDHGYVMQRTDDTHADSVSACTACGADVQLVPTGLGPGVRFAGAPLDLPGLIAAWEHEASVAEQLRRVDGYAALCRETVKALRELKRRQLTRCCQGADPACENGRACAWIARHDTEPERGAHR
jgi:hypothetical protein